MSHRLPIHAQVLILFGLNLVMVAAAVLMILRVQESTGYQSLLHGQAAYGLRAAAEDVAENLSTHHWATWDAELDELSAKYGVRFLLYSMGRGITAGSDEVELPKSVEAEFLAGMPPPPPTLEGPPQIAPDAVAVPLFMMRAGNPPQYWVAVQLRVRDAPQHAAPAGTVLLLVSPSFTANGLLFDWRPWMLGALALLIGGVLLWLPFIHHMNRYLSDLSAATETIAAGDFDVTIDTRRNDEFGRLGKAIQHMAGRLDGLVNDQKRFLGGIAHELCSPLARIKIALGILEQRTSGREAEYVADALDEAEHMSAMVNELLDFSRQSLTESAVEPEPVSLEVVINQVLHRELEGDAEVRVEMPEPLSVMGNEALLVRALGNLLRNAQRYAGKDGPIIIAARPLDNRVELTVADNGPGVPDAMLPRLFDPFYRVDTSRSRDTGGTGLGLTIVQRCVDLCGGTVTARNRAKGGLAMTILLRPATV